VRAAFAGARGGLATASASLVLLLLLAAPAGAHPYLVASTPQGGVVSPSAPTSVQIAFTEEIVIKGCSITVTAQNGRAIPTGPLRAALGGYAMTTSFKTLPEGIYQVKWVAYGDDGHTVEGAYRFGVPSASGQAPPGAGTLLATTTQSAEQAPTESLVSIAGRWLAAVAAFALLGGALLLRWIRGRLDEDIERDAERRWHRLALPTLGVALAGTLMEAIERARAPRGGLDFGLLSSSTTGWTIVARLIVLALGAALAAALARRGRPADRERRLAALGFIGMLALGALAIDGHVATVRDTPALAAAGQVLHLLSGGAWMGAVIVLAACVAPAAFAAGRPNELLTATRAYTPIALVAAALTIATGLIAAVREVSRWYFLRWSSYGHLVIIKVVVVGVAMAIGLATALLARRALRAGDEDQRSLRRAGWLVRAEALAAVVTIAVAALLAGTLQGRGQSLPSQRGNLLPGAGFADVALAGSTAQLTLAPATVGLNRIDVTLARSPQTFSSPPPVPKTVTVSFACDCSKGPLSFHATLQPGSGGTANAWSAEVGIPEDGTYSAELKINGQPTVGSPTFTVGDISSPGSTPVEVASVADLSGPDALDCRTQELGVLVAIELMNASGGVGGRKIHQILLDDGGSARVARSDALQLQTQHPAAFLAPCGQGAQGAIQAVGGQIPTIVADPNVPVTPGRQVFRFAPNPYDEGYAAGQYIGEIGLPSTPKSTPRRVAAFIGTSPTSQQRLAGLKAELARYGVAVKVFPAEGPQLVPNLLATLPASQWLGMYMDGEFDTLSAALRQVGNETYDKVNPTPIIVSAPLSSERFVIDSGLLGAQGQIRAISDVDPTSNDASLYATLVPQVVGELATIPGLEGFVAGQALAYGLVHGTSVSAIDARLENPGVFSTIATSPWSNKDPASGTVIFKMLLAQFLTDNLIPTASNSPGEPYEGQFFDDGAWEPAASEFFSPLHINLGAGVGSLSNSYSTESASGTKG
jgi:methionine-rich copper-binding protein CopC/putative copper export protein/ABC-type branched-subunit amino acid transport system substrate-binding protein